MRKIASAAVVAMTLIVACAGGSTNLDIVTYDRTCRNLNDCTLAVSDACCGCPLWAINVASQAQYETDLANAKKNCGGVVCSNAPCEAVVPGCQATECVAEPAPIDGGAE